MRRIEKTNRTFAKLVLTAVILFLLIIAAEHGTMTVLAEEPAVYSAYQHQPAQHGGHDGYYR